MLIAIVVTLVEAEILSWTWIIVGIIIGSLIGAVAARMVKMTAMPEMVGIFNGFGGGASALVAGAEFFRLQQAGALPLGEGSTIMLGMLIGAVTFSGSVVAFGKLAGLDHRKPGDQQVPAGPERRPLPRHPGGRRLHGRAGSQT